MKKITIILGAVIVMVFASFRISAEVIKDVPEDLLPAAQKILSQRFEEFKKQDRGFPPYFNKWDVFRDFRLGEPYPHYKLYMYLIYGLKDNSDFKDALKFLTWQVPVYFGAEEEPRTVFNFIRGSDGKWRSPGGGGYADHMLEARVRWPSEEGYKHASVLTNNNASMIMLEKDSEIEFYYYEKDEGGEKVFGISKKEDGSYPLFSRDHLIEVIKSDEKYRTPHQGLN